MFLFIEKFKKPADDEDIYEPNRPTKSTKVKVKLFFLYFSSITSILLFLDS